MSNICSNQIKLIFGQKRACKLGADAINRRVQSTPLGYGTGIGKNPPYQYLFDVDANIEERTLIIDCWTKWDLDARTISELILWMESLTGDLQEAQASYDESGSLLFGTYEWDRESDVLLQTSLPYANYEACIADCIADEGDEYQYDTLYKSLENALKLNSEEIYHGRILNRKEELCQHAV